MQSKRSEFQELKLKDLPKRKDKEEDDCCWSYFELFNWYVVIEYKNGGYLRFPWRPLPSIRTKSNDLGQTFS